jgi:hypothetical protein
MFVVALGLLGLAVGVGGLIFSLVKARRTTQVFWHKPDLAVILVTAAAVTMVAVVIAAVVPGGIALFAVIMGIGAIALKSSLQFGNLALKEYAFVESGRSLVDVWHDERGSSYVALKSTKVTKSSLGFQAAVFAPKEPIRVISRDGIEIWVDLGLAYFIKPAPEADAERDARLARREWRPSDKFPGSWELWRLGPSDSVRDNTVKPQVAQAVRRIFGQHLALPAVSIEREMIRTEIFDLLKESLPLQNVLPLGLTLGGTFAEPELQKAWMQRALINIDPALSSHKLEEMRIQSVSQAGTIVVPGDMALHLSLPGRTPPADVSV